MPAKVRACISVFRYTSAVFSRFVNARTLSELFITLHLAGLWRVNSDIFVIINLRTQLHAVIHCVAGGFANQLLLLIVKFWIMPASINHLHLIIVLFILLEFCIFVYQVFAVFQEPNQQKRWVLLVLSFLFVLLNLTDDVITDYGYLTVLNIVFLGTILIWLVLNRYSKARKRQEAIPSNEQRTEMFLRQCKSYELTNRETEIVLLLKQGYRYKAIADKLFISERTVDKHIRNIYEKVGVNNKIALLNKLYNDSAETSI